MYLEHFNLHTLPFTLTPNTNFYCNLPGHQAVFNVLMISLQNGEGFIKVTAEVGAGKTLLCRKLLNALDERFVAAFIPNPDLTAEGLRKSLACELSIQCDPGVDQHTLMDLITKRLIQIHRENKQAVLVIDEAQALPDECLEALRLLTNLETESKKLLHVVLFGQPELDTRLAERRFRQLKQRIAFSCHLQPLAKQEVKDYVNYRLVKAGQSLGSIFSRSASDLLYRASGGVPRVINILCHKAMMAAFGRGETRIGTKAMKRAIADTEWTAAACRKRELTRRVILSGLVLCAMVLGYFIGAH